MASVENDMSASVAAVVALAITVASVVVVVVSVAYVVSSYP